MSSNYTIGHYLLDRLAELGVHHMFGVPGDYNLSFLDESSFLVDSADLRSDGERISSASIMAFSGSIFSISLVTRLTRLIFLSLVDTTDPSATLILCTSNPSMVLPFLALL